MTKKWARVSIKTETGQRDAIAPEVLSASRATDIPAFHTDHFFAQIQKGHCTWINPFNQRSQYISFCRARAFVFWTKNPTPMLSRLETLEKEGYTYYFQFTLNDYEPEKIEPSVPPLKDRIVSFCQLANQIGTERVIWRFDPLLLTDHITVDDLIKRIEQIGDQIHHATQKLVFSFVDLAIYPRVRHTLKLRGLQTVREFTHSEQIEFCEKLVDITRHWGLVLATCAESLELDQYGIIHNKCVDDELLLQLAPHDPMLANALKKIRTGTLKDHGQRKLCRCVPSKDIGAYHTCAHLCAYCYANSRTRHTPNHNTELSQSICS